MQKEKCDVQNGLFLVMIYRDNLVYSPILPQEHYLPLFGKDMHATTSMLNDTHWNDGCQSLPSVYCLGLIDVGCKSVKEQMQQAVNASTGDNVYR